MKHHTIGHTLIAWSGMHAADLVRLREIWTAIETQSENCTVIWSQASRCVWLVLHHLSPIYASIRTAQYFPRECNHCATSTKTSRSTLHSTITFEPIHAAVMTHCRPKNVGNQNALGYTVYLVYYQVGTKNCALIAQIYFIAEYVYRETCFRVYQLKPQTLSKE